MNSNDDTTMTPRLQIVFRNMTSSAAVEATIRKEFDWLEFSHDKIMSCQVVVEQLHRHHRQGNLFHVRVNLKVPGRELVVSRDHAQHHGHEDIYVTIRDAFLAIRRQLESYVERRRGDVKLHQA